VLSNSKLTKRQYLKILINNLSPGALLPLCPFCIFTFHVPLSLPLSTVNCKLYNIYVDTIQLHSPHFCTLQTTQCAEKYSVLPLSELYNKKITHLFKSLVHFFFLLVSVGTLSKCSVDSTQNFAHAQKVFLFCWAAKNKVFSAQCQQFLNQFWNSCLITRQQWQPLLQRYYWALYWVEWASHPKLQAYCITSLKLCWDPLFPLKMNFQSHPHPLHLLASKFWYVTIITHAQHDHQQKCTFDH